MNSISKILIIAFVLVLGAVGIFMLNGKKVKPFLTPTSSPSSPVSSSMPSPVLEPNQQPLIVPTSANVPKGIFVTTNSPVESFLDKTFVDGVLIRASWEEIQPSSENSYDWGKIDSRLKAARDRGKKVSIAIFPGKDAIPDWVFAKGVRKWTGKVGTLADPMDPLFYTLWFKLVDEFGKRYNNDTTVSHIYICGGTGLRCGLRFADLPPGWDRDVILGYWETTVARYVAAFSNKPLGFEIHSTPGEGVALAEAMMNHNYDTYGSKIGVFEEFLSATAPAAKLAAPVTTWGPKSGKTWCGFQTVSALGADLDAAYRHGYNDFGCAYFEIYGVDASNSTYASINEKWHATIWR